MTDPKMPEDAIVKDNRVYDRNGHLIEIYKGKWLIVKNGSRSGWWRFHEHYDRNGYCDNPARGY
jgi:hypothetical protein